VSQDGDFIPLAEAVAEARAAGDIPDDGYSPPGEPVTPCAAPRFKLEPFAEIEWTGAGEWLLQGLLPLQGLAVVYGASGSHKSFIAADLALRIVRGLEWAGRAVKQGAAVYVAAEGSAGFRKRIEAFRRKKGMRGAQPFYLVSAAPNLGGESNDLEALIASIEATALAAPLRLIVVDTLAQTLHGAEENGRGMMALISNANALASRFDCLVLVVHHSGKNDDNGARGHSSLPGAADAIWLVKKGEAGLSSTITIEKNKDDAGGLTFSAALSRVVIDVDEETGEEVSSLVVEDVTETETAGKTVRQSRIAPSLRLFIACIAEAIGNHGREIKPFADGPTVCAATENAAREIFYRRAPESRESEDDPKRRADRQRKAFQRGRSAALANQSMCATTINGECWLWLP
jgi:hypothetical protein